MFYSRELACGERGRDKHSGALEERKRTCQGLDFGFAYTP